jgi:hypothetical protein
MTSGETRTIGTDYTAVSNTPAFGASNLKIYGGKVKTDQAYIRRGVDIGDQRLLDLRNFSKSLGRYFMDKLINEALAAATFSGLKEQATALSRVTHYVGSDGGSFPAGTVATDVKLQHGFFETLDAEIEVVNPDVLVMPGALKARLKAVARGALEVINVQDFYGANQRVETYNGIPIVNAGYAANGSTSVITITETLGNSGAACTSLYLLKFGEAEDITVSTNVGMDVEDLGLVGTEYITMVEFDVDLLVLNAKALGRIDGIKLG